MKRHQASELKRYDQQGARIMAGSAFIPTASYSLDCSCGWRGRLYSFGAGAALEFVDHVRADALAEAARRIDSTAEFLAELAR